MKNTYKILCGFYDLLDVFYFTKHGKNPRQEILNLVPETPVSILDVCTGTGTNAILLGKNKKNSTIIGIDRSEKMLEIATLKIEKNNIKGVKVIHGDAMCMPIEDGSVDIAVISLVLHEMEEDLAKNILNEIKRILKVSGHLIVLEWEPPTSLWKKIMFVPIKLLEPRSFHKFCSINKEEYFSEYGFAIKKEIHCDYSCVYELIKSQE